jgi:hypothetical protein
MNREEKQQVERLIRLLSVEFPNLLPYQIALTVQVQLGVQLTGLRVKHFLEGEPL